MPVYLHYQLTKAINAANFKEMNNWTLYVIYSQQTEAPYSINGKMFTGTEQEMLDKKQEIISSGAAIERFDLCED